MRLKFFFISWFCFQGIGFCYAQWNKKDSIWLQDILSGKEEIKLNPEVQKAIESGTLIQTDESINQFLSAPPLLPIIKEFTDIIESDPYLKDVDFDSIPPSVLMLTKLHADSSDLLKIRMSLTGPKEKLLEKEKIKLGNLPVDVAVGIEDIYLKEVKDGQSRGAFKGKVNFQFSLEDILLFTFRKSERAKRKNRKHAKAWETYNTPGL